MRFLRFDDFETRLSRVSTDKLAPIREILDHIKYTLNTSYIPHTFLTIDEHVCTYRGRCSFRQFLPSKPDKYGIKIFILADSSTYYPYNIEVYSGKISLSNKPEDIVLRLLVICRPGHVVVGDNYFTSLSLCNALVDRFKIRYFGTLRCNRREVPDQMKVAKNMTLYSSRFLYYKDSTMVSYIAKKNKSILLLSNYHHDGSISDMLKQKPQLILDYNRHKCGVDILDQMLKGYRPYRATWPKYTRREVKIHISAWTSLIIHIAQKSRGTLQIAQFRLPKTYIRIQRMAPIQQQCHGCYLGAFSTTYLTYHPSLK